MLKKISHSEWASPVVPVSKADGSIRICGDYKVTVNPVLQVDQFPMPRPEDLFVTLAGGRKFSKLDLTHAYQQVLLHPEYDLTWPLTHTKVCISTDAYTLVSPQRQRCSSRQWRRCCKDCQELSFT